MTNIMDSFFDNAMTNVTDGTFKAVVLSGITNEAPPGEGTDTADASITGGFVNVIVKPLTPFGDMLPDPRSYTSANEINYVIGMHASMYTARSDHPFDAANPVQFGQVIDCYFESGNISNSDFRGLRFAKPVGYAVDQSFESLALTEGVVSATAADWANCGLLGDPSAYGVLGAEHLGAAQSNFAPRKFGEPGSTQQIKWKAAWEALRPFLPEGTRLTSAYRSQANQESIIRNFAKEYGWTGGTTSKTDIDQMHAFVRKKPKPGIVVNRNVGRGHGGVGGTGAIDLAPKRGSSTTLDQIWAGVQAANIALAGQVKYSKFKRKGGNSSILERNNGCVHVAFYLSEINIQPTTIELQQKYDGKTMYFVPGDPGPKTGQFVTEDDKFYFKWVDGDGDNRKLRIFK